eukprot:COSAG02_NODE_38749_length_425_cov_1.095092_2_plen_39_part_01
MSTLYATAYDYQLRSFQLQRTENAPGSMHRKRINYVGTW